MRVILLKDIPKIGQKDQILDLAPGYVRNYLFPRKLAIPATEANLKRLKIRLEKKAKEREERLKKLRELAKELATKSLSIEAEVGPKGKLFGSVTSSQIKKVLEEKYKLEIPEENIILSEPIKKLGKYHVKIKFTPEIVTEIKLEVKAKKSKK